MSEMVFTGDDKICLIDMDGTLFDYEGQLRSDLKKIAGPDDPNFDEIELWEEARQQPWLKARIDLIKNQPDWWRNLPPLEIGFALRDMAFSEGFHCKILTKGPRSRPDAWAEKLRCIDAHFGNDHDFECAGGTDKYPPKSGTFGRVLIDDYPDYMRGWLKHRPRGLGLMPAQRCNKGFQHPNVLVIDGSKESMILAKNALAAAYRRESGQHWRELFDGPPGSGVSNFTRPQN